MSVTPNESSWRRQREDGCVLEESALVLLANANDPQGSFSTIKPGASYANKSFYPRPPAGGAKSHQPTSAGLG